MGREEDRGRDFNVWKIEAKVATGVSLSGWLEA